MRCLIVCSGENLACGQFSPDLGRYTEKKMKDEFIEYELVLESQSSGDIIFLKSLLDAEQITYFVQGEHVSHYVYHSVPMRLIVKKGEVAKVQELLKNVELSSTYSGFKRSGKNNEV
ncbi:MAG TPA: hypothetical protein HPP69_05815 [Deltaproteobacteria bacterium]|nr:hypothetical protein [Deltaproteobacteria bacterium]